MTAETLQSIAGTNQWAALMPEIALGLLAVLLLVLEMVLPKRLHDAAIPRVAIWGQIAVFVAVLLNFDCPFIGQDLFGGMIELSRDGQLMRLFFLLASVLVCFIASISLGKQSVPRVEFYHVVLVATAAMMLLANSNHFVMLFVALETVTVALYILVSYFRHSPFSLEAGLKYLVLGALSSAILLFGIVLLYGTAGNAAFEGSTQQAMNFSALRNFLEANPENPIALAGVVLVLCGIAFKIGAVPFQIWIPDVYQGAPTPVTAFLSVSSKAAGFALLMLLVRGVFSPVQHVVVPLLSMIAILSLAVGNITAVGQQNVKRVMGLSGISHAGFMLMGIVASVDVPWATGAVYFYLLTYLLASMAVFAVMAVVAGEEDSAQELRHYTDLARGRPLLGATLAIGLGSLAGIPPLAGFMGKLLIFIAAFQAELWLLLGVGVVSVVISIYYYFGWIRAAVFANTSGAVESAPTGPGRLGALTMVSLSIAIVLLGVFQGPLGDWLAAR
jgi:NADH-quinone oxidoreductase subunit N